MMKLAGLPLWTLALPLAGWGLVAATVAGPAGLTKHREFLAVLAAALAGSVPAAVHHAEVVAHKAGEPSGTLVLAVTVIEVALIVSLMPVAGPEGAALARADRLQTSLNLALGAALATIGLTIPTVAVLSLGTGRTTVLQGAVHLVILATFLFTTVVP
jgi:Ca2+/H+ antiporter